MKGKASAGRGVQTKSLFDSCRILNLTAETENDAEMLACIYRTLFGFVGDGPYIAIIDPKKPGLIGRWESSGVKGRPL